MSKVEDAKKSTVRSAAPKYRDPKSGRTWSGRGRMPRWIQGEDRTPFLIEKPN
jgi:DNA-binding protein H-NS